MGEKFASNPSNTLPSLLGLHSSRGEVSVLENYSFENYRCLRTRDRKLLPSIGDSISIFAIQVVGFACLVHHMTFMRHSMASFVTVNLRCLISVMGILRSIKFAGERLFNVV